jgi:hypothetical protein
MSTPIKSSKSSISLRRKLIILQSSSSSIATITKNFIILFHPKMGLNVNNACRHNRLSTGGVIKIDKGEICNSAADTQWTAVIVLRRIHRWKLQTNFNYDHGTSFKLPINESIYSSIQWNLLNQFDIRFERNSRCDLLFFPLQASLKLREFRPHSAVSFQSLLI